jgi:deazaflavin-dependent oxidoreductase (nitroreductase family)
MMDRNQLAKLADEEFCYLTTTGRVSGLLREIEIWFAISESTVYMLSGGRDRSNWVRNLHRRPEVTVRISGQVLQGTARTVDEPGDEDALARKLLVDKYQPIHDGDLADWGKTSLPVAIDVRN